MINKMLTHSKTPAFSPEQRDFYKQHRQEMEAVLQEHEGDHKLVNILNPFSMPFRIWRQQDLAVDCHPFCAALLLTRSFLKHADQRLQQDISDVERDMLLEKVETARAAFRLCHPPPDFSVVL